MNLHRLISNLDAGFPTTPAISMHTLLGPKAETIWLHTSLLHSLIETNKRITIAPLWWGRGHLKKTTILVLSMLKIVFRADNSVTRFRWRPTYCTAHWNSFYNNKTRLVTVAMRTATRSAAAARRHLIRLPWYSGLFPNKWDNKNVFLHKTVSDFSVDWSTAVHLSSSCCMLITVDSVIVCFQWSL